ncbi:MAG: hypothetical protein CL908_09635 [Deltaproteobacteria bacterium]|nr:hypothetical protein [Deltaproteobacteria bacterium]
MIRALFVTHSLDFEAGGAERVLYDLLVRLDRSRFEPFIFTGSDLAGVPEAFSALDIPIETGPRLPMEASLGLTGLWKTGKALLSLMAGLHRTLRRYPVEVVHVNTVFALHFALLPCRLAGVPVVFHEHNLVHQREGSVWQRRYAKRMKHVEHVAANSGAVREEAIRAGADPARISTVYNGIDPMPPASKAEKRPGFSIVQAANFLDWKGQHLVVEALGRLRENVPEATVTFFGSVKDKAYHDRVRARIAELGLEEAVEFAGFRNDLLAQLPGFDCLVVASDAEPFGLVLLEGMRAGLVIVASDAGGVPEIVRDETNGLLFDTSDDVGLAEALTRVATEPDIRARFVEAGHRTVSQVFSLDVQIRRFEEVLEAASKRLPVRLAPEHFDGKPL